MNSFITSRKFAWIAGILITALYFGPSVLRFFAVTAMRMGSSASAAVAAKPSPSIPQQSVAPQEVASAVPAPAVEIPQLVPYLGFWQGDLHIDGRGMCRLHVEVKDNHSHEHPLAGYSTLSCAPLPIEIMANKQSGAKNPTEAILQLADDMSPTYAVLPGNIQNDALVLAADKNIGVAQKKDGCPMTALTLTPFATGQMVGDWKESQQGSCQGGQMMLIKTVR